MLQQPLEKTVLWASEDALVTAYDLAIAENIRGGQPLLLMGAIGKQRRSFNAPDDRLSGLLVGAMIRVTWQGAQVPAATLGTELVPRGSFATLQAGRAVGNQDRNMLRLHLDQAADIS